MFTYHAIQFSHFLSLAKRLKRFKLLLETEELYQNASPHPKHRIKAENRIIHDADAFIFSSDMLNSIVNTAGKPSVTAHGTYALPPAFPKLFSDQKIHLVYSGTLKHDRGALTVIAMAQHLPTRYHIHILGTGTPSEIDQVCNAIADVSAQEQEHAAVTFHGQLRGDEYLQFLQSCHIGMSPQSIDGFTNATSFPSKALAYLANGLRVVSVRIPVVETSAIHDMMIYYDDPTPSAIAQVVMSVDTTTAYDSRLRIKELDEQFTLQLNALLVKFHEAV